MTIRIEAETMNLTTYRVESNMAPASGNALITLHKSGGTQGSASTTFTGATGTYEVIVGYFDENDGRSQLSVSIGDNSYSWRFDQNLSSGGVSSSNAVRKTLAQSITINHGDAINLFGQVEGTEFARVDYLEFVPVAVPPPTSIDKIAPKASLTAANLTSAGVSSYSFSVTYSDDIAVKVTSLDNNDVRVVGPNGFNRLATLVSVDSNSQGTPRRATYKIDAVGGSWDSADNGNYTVEMQANQVSDTSNNFVSAGSLGRFEVNIREEPTLPPPSAMPMRIEAETMNLTTYRVESNMAPASGNALITLHKSGGTQGSAFTRFTGATGTYEVIVGYFDENDGRSPLSVSIGDDSYSWRFDQNLSSGGVSSSNAVRKTLAQSITINHGDAINLFGQVEGTEFARVDYLEFVPVAVPPPSSSNNFIGGAGSNAFSGGDGMDTVTYAQATGGIVANLGTGIVTRKFAPLASRPVKFLPLGDSITYGVINSQTSPHNTESGGYRTYLWNKFMSRGFSGAVDFVGSLENGPSSIDNDHEGHRGYTIERLATDINLNQKLSNESPNFVLLMAGTNDMKFADAGTAHERLGNLIDQIAQVSPNTHILVASIPPIPRSETQHQQAVTYNQRLPEVVEEKLTEGKKVTFVDMFNSLTKTDIADGVHPSAKGYQKIANNWSAWIDSSQDNLSSIENLVGTAYNDQLIGSSGFNSIDGGAGNDLIRGGGSNDRLTGGAGRDTFVLATGEGFDTIVDFKLGQDWLGLVNNLRVEQLTITQGTGKNSNDTLINFTNSNEALALLSGVQAERITPDIFTFV